MNILKNPEQAIVPVNQPAHFPTFYFIPETSTIPSQHPASNDPTFHQYSPTRIQPPQENRLQKFLRQEREIFQETCADAWTAIKQAGRDAAHGLARWVVLPLSIASALYIPSIHPMELLPL
jgi:hypothetical protein